MRARGGPRRRYWHAAALYLVLLAAFGVGLWASYRAVFPAPGLHRVTGVLEARSGETMILVRHDAVPGLMEAMPSMIFFVESKELLDRAGLAPGDRIRFTLRQTPDKLMVVEIRKIQ